jgi:hypothetical protein
LSIIVDEDLITALVEYLSCLIYADKICNTLKETLTLYYNEILNIWPVS